MTKGGRTIKKFFVIPLCILLAVALFCAGAYFAMSFENVRTSQSVGAGYDAILVLGCKVYPDGSLSPMLRDRMDQGIALYRAGVAPKLLLSGDHGRADYDEVGSMFHYALGQGVPQEDIFLDHAGFSTYESVYRARAIYGLERPVIVSQGFHVPRALFIARCMGMDAAGVGCDYRPYNNIWYNHLREVPARIHDFLQCVLHVPPRYLGEAIPILSSDAALTQQGVDAPTKP